MRDTLQSDVLYSLLFLHELASTEIQLAFIIYIVTLRCANQIKYQIQILSWCWHFNSDSTWNLTELFNVNPTRLRWYELNWQFSLNSRSLLCSLPQCVHLILICACLLSIQRPTSTASTFEFCVDSSRWRFNEKCKAKLQHTMAEAKKTTTASLFFFTLLSVCV